ncbi:hypothetical protein ADL22_04340 [Streptomyces sp. NRRL F-4489]|nr:hypothetical protein ADL22_04340 [Streptomyces sp. NRRL F-4489]
MVLLGVPHDALQRVNPAEPRGQLLGGQELHRLDIPLRGLAVAGNFHLLPILVPHVLELRQRLLELTPCKDMIAMRIPESERSDDAGEERCKHRAKPGDDRSVSGL